jgi:predicted RNA-binding Zn-ribbon protein involved in translation (DUF1610 family)
MDHHNEERFISRVLAQLRMSSDPTIHACSACGYAEIARAHTGNTNPTEQKCPVFSKKLELIEGILKAYMQALESNENYQKKWEVLEQIIALYQSIDTNQTNQSSDNNPRR